jgi:hypothetical protein
MLVAPHGKATPPDGPRPFRDLGPFDQRARARRQNDHPDQEVTPADQLDQRCDIEAMDRLQADKVISYTFSHPKRTAVHVDADGAVFRRNGDWYRLSYACTTSPDHLSIVAFAFKRGAIIARKDWTRYYLYP